MCRIAPYKGGWRARFNARIHAIEAMLLPVPSPDYFGTGLKVHRTSSRLSPPERLYSLSSARGRGGGGGRGAGPETDSRAATGGRAQTGAQGRGYLPAPDP